MSLQLLDLSHELILQIVDYLLDQEKDSDTNDIEDETLADLKSDTEAAEADGLSKGDSQEEDTRTDETTDDASGRHGEQDPEYQNKEGGLASKVVSSGEQDIFNLSCTCTSFYKILSPCLFRSITLRNTRKSGAAVLYLCSTNQIAYAKTLHFKGTAPGQLKEGFRDVDGVFPPEVKTVLTDLSQFPCLETLIVDFDFHLNEEDGFEHWDDVLVNLTADDDDETVEEIEKAEEQEAWRALIKKTFEAICMDASNGIRELVVKDCPIRVNSVLGSGRFNKVCGTIIINSLRVFSFVLASDCVFRYYVSFHTSVLSHSSALANRMELPADLVQWLENLESFKFEIYGADTGAGWYADPTSIHNCQSAHALHGVPSVVGESSLAFARSAMMSNPSSC